MMNVVSRMEVRSGNIFKDEVDVVNISESDNNNVN